MAKDNRPKILFIVQLPPPVHGSATISKVLVESSLINTSFYICVIPLHFSKSMSEIGAFSGTKIFKSIGYAFQILRTLRSFKPDLVYFTIAPIGPSFYRDILYVLILKMWGAKITYHLHVRGIREQSNRAIKKSLYRYVFRDTFIITLSKHLVEDLTSVYDKQPFVVNNGIPVVTTDISVLRSRASDTVQILYLSNFARSKGVFVLLMALSKLRKKGVSFKAAIVGKPADVAREEIEHFVTANGLSEVVTVEDAKYETEKHAAFINADIFVHPTMNDAFPLVVLEAMQFQLPVVSTFEGAIPEIVDNGRTGFLVSKGDHEELEKKIENLILNRHLREEMGRAGRNKFLSSYTADIMELNLRKTLEQICRA